MSADEPRPPRRPPPPRPNFDGWDVDELGEYADQLRTEIGRAEAAMAAKRAVRSAAETFFRKPTDE